MAQPPVGQREPRYQEVLRRLSLNDDRFVAEMLAGGIDGPSPGPPLSDLDPRTRRLATLAALIAIEAGEATVAAAVERALGAGASVEQIVDVLLSVAPSVGSARVVAAAPRIAASVGYDLSQAYEDAPLPTR
jgi:alkylhydroperoxidase/carboxymuconolactone decarboxylase family protein YurZ